MEIVAFNRDPLFVILGVIAILYGASRLEYGESFSQYVDATITNISSVDTHTGTESLLYVTYSVDGKEHSKTLRASGGVYFADQVIELVHALGQPEGAILAPPVSATLDAWCCIGLGVLLLLM